MKTDSEETLQTQPLNEDSKDSQDDEKDEEDYDGALKVTRINNRRYIRMPNFAKRSVNILKQWLNHHLDNPYPTHREKDALSKESGLSKRQIQNWFTNARKRIWQPMIKHQEKSQIKQLQDADYQSHQQNLAQEQPFSPKEPFSSNQSQHLNFEFQNLPINSHPLSQVKPSSPEVQNKNTLSLNQYGENTDKNPLNSYLLNALQSQKILEMQQMINNLDNANRKLVNTSQPTKLVRPENTNFKPDPLKAGQPLLINAAQANYLQYSFNNNPQSQQLMMGMPPFFYPMNLQPIHINQTNNIFFQQAQTNHQPQQPQQNQDIQQLSHILRPTPSYKVRAVQNVQSVPQQKDQLLISNPQQDQ